MNMKLKSIKPIDFMVSIGSNISEVHIVQKLDGDGELIFIYD